MNSMTRSRLVAVGALGLSAALLLTGCGRGGDAPAPSGDGDGSAASAPGFDGETITLGALSVTSGPLAVPASTILSGQQAYYDAVNAEGGIAGKYPIKLQVLDTAYDGPTAVQQYSASKGDVVAYTQIFGTSIANALLPDLTEDGIYGIPSSSDGMLLQEEPLILTGNVAEIDAVAGLEWAHQEDPEGTFCYAAMDGALGESYGSALEWTAEQLGTEISSTVVLDPALTDYTPQIQQLISAGCDVVFEKGSGAVLTPALQASAQLGLDALWIAPYTDWTPNLKDSPLNDFLTEHFVATSNAVVYGDDAAGMDKLVADHEEYAADVLPTWLYTNGYVSAKIMVDFLEKAAENGDFSREGMQEVVQSFDTLDFDGIQAPQPFGPAGERGVATLINILSYSAESVTGLTVSVNEFQSEHAAEYPIGG